MHFVAREQYLRQVCLSLSIASAARSPAQKTPKQTKLTCHYRCRQLGHSYGKSAWSQAQQVVLWQGRPELAEAIESDRQNRAYLPEVLLPPAVKCTADLAEAATGAGLIILTTPSHAIRQTAQQLACLTSVRMCHCCIRQPKRLEAGTYKRMSQIIAEEIPQLAGKVGAISGPNHAEEVGRQHPSASVVATVAKSAAETVQDAYMLPYFRVYTNLI